MSQNTNELNAKSKEDKKAKNKEKLEKKDKKVVKKKDENRKENNSKNKSVQNRVIENIKNFISKIAEMQEKVKKDEAEEKELAQKEKLEEGKDINTVNNDSKYLLEYYDLPFRYNETVVKILAQTPKRLFVYWDVSDRDKQTYLNAFGETFFYDTYPVLLVHNENKNYTSEVAINDFANSWYLDISHPRDKYIIQLGRKFKNHIKPKINSEMEEENLALNNDYLFIAMSNKLEIPNDHILFEEFKPYIKYRNVKTKEENTKDVTNFIYDNQLKKLYHELYDEEFKITEGEYDMLNPSSNLGTSSSISFK